jgi:hypothetical protein
MIKNVIMKNRCSSGTARHPESLCPKLPANKGNTAGLDPYLTGALAPLRQPADFDANIAAEAAAFIPLRWRTAPRFQGFSPAFRRVTARCYDESQL